MRAVLPEAEIRSWSRRSAQLVGGGDLEELVRAADVVCTCTNAPEPVLRREWLRPGAHVNAVGSSGTWARELDAETVAAASLFVDRRESALNESGEYRAAVDAGAIGPEHILAELGEVLVGDHPGRRSDDELTLFKSLGLAVEDLAAAELVVERARAEGAGTEVEF
jgi:ornithine cyclodeaminase